MNKQINKQINKAISIAKKIKREKTKITIGEFLKMLYENEVISLKNYTCRINDIHYDDDFYKKNTATVDIIFFLGEESKCNMARVSIQYYLKPEQDWSLYNLDYEIHIGKINKEFYL